MIRNSQMQQDQQMTTKSFAFKEAWLNVSGKKINSLETIYCRKQYLSKQKSHREHKTSFKGEKVAVKISNSMLFQQNISFKLNKLE